MRLLERDEVVADVLADGGVWAAARLDGADSLDRQRLVTLQELGVLAREDVVRHDAQSDARLAGLGRGRAASAVFPLPTGPPIPTVNASARAVVARRERGARVVVTMLVVSCRVPCIRALSGLKQPGVQVIVLAGDDLQPGRHLRDRVALELAATLERPDRAAERPRAGSTAPRESRRAPGARRQTGDRGASRASRGAERPGARPRAQRSRRRTEARGVRRGASRAPGRAAAQGQARRSYARSPTRGRALAPGSRGSSRRRSGRRRRRRRPPRARRRGAHDVADERERGEARLPDGVANEGARRAPARAPQAARRLRVPAECANPPAGNAAVGELQRDPIHRPPLRRASIAAPAAASPRDRTAGAHRPRGPRTSRGRR